MEKKLRKAVFFDRDGTLNVDHGYVREWSNFTWIPGARDAIKLANDNQYLVFVVTNQSGIGRGYYGIEEVNRLHGQMNRDLATIGGHIDAFELCPHHPREANPEYLKTCNCRKPAPGMLLKLIEEWQINTSESLMIGDHESDIAAATKAKVAGHLFTGSNLLDFVSQLVKS